MVAESWGSTQMYLLALLVVVGAPIVSASIKLNLSPTRKNGEKKMLSVGGIN